MSDQIKNNSDFYVVGGTMKADAPSYIRRKADKELYKHIRKGDFCCVLTPRQMGKSSLMIHTADRLKKEGIRTAIIDLTQIGTEKKKASADQWYYGIAYRILRELGMKTKLSDWWQEREKLPALQRLTEFFEDVLLPSTHEPVVIFVDEIDTTIALPFTDDFFAAIRACYNARAAKTEYQRLNFVLLGVASPSDLIKDARRTPFNIGHSIHLTDFTLEEAKPLSLGLRADPGQGEKMLARILYWTGGHPYLTQKLCRIAAHEKLAVHSDEAIDNMVEKNFLSPGANRQEPNLKFVSDRLLSDYMRGRQLRKRLKVYHRILSGDQLLDNPNSFAYTKLKLSGVVVVGINQQLKVRNRMYQYIFNINWVREEMPSNFIRNIGAFFILISFIFFSLLYLNALKDTIKTAQDDVPISEYNSLKQIPFFSRSADKLFAGYWGRRSLSEEAKGDRRKALIYQLKALTVDDTDIRRIDISVLKRSIDNKDDANSTIIFRHESPINIVAINPDGSKLLTVGNDSSIRLWNTDTGKLIKENEKMESLIDAATFTRDGNSVLIGNSIGINKWDSNPTEEIRTFIPSDNNSKSNTSILMILLNPIINSEILLTSDLDGKVCLWDIESRKKFPEITVMSEATIKFVVFHQNGKDILIGNSDNEIHFWEITEKKTASKSGSMHEGKSIPLLVRKRIPPIEKKHSSILNVATFRSNGEVLIGSTDGTLELYSADRLSEPIYSRKFGSPIEAVTFIDEKNVIYATERWINKSKISKEGFSFPDKRFLPGRWTSAYRFLDETGDKIKVALKVTDDSIKIYTIRFDKEDVEPIGGNPEELLKEWQKKLALKLDEKTGKIVPMYQ